jgi:hypothetical protein
MSRDHKTEAETLQADIDRLIDAYESGAYRNGSGQIRVACEAKELIFAFVDQAGNIVYRGRTLIPMGRRSVTRKRANADWVSQG